MFRHRHASPITVAGALLLASCSVLNEIISESGDSTIRGSGTVTEETRNVSGFTGIELATLGTLYVEQGDREELRLEAEDNLIAHLRTRVEGRLLRIETPSGVNLQPTRPVRYYLTVRDLDRLILSGSGSIEAENLRARRLAVTLNGSGGVQLPGLNAEALTVAVSGSGGLSASGRVTTQDLNLSGSGPFDGRELESARAGVNISGSGSATLRVRERLDATLSGSGSVRYYGNPRVNQNVSGSGSVVRVGS